MVVVVCPGCVVVDIEVVVVVVGIVVVDMEVVVIVVGIVVVEVVVTPGSYEVRVIGEHVCDQLLDHSSHSECEVEGVCGGTVGEFHCAQVDC